MATAAMLSSADVNQLNTLRVELKQWEKAFADANGGRKAGRHDIKQDPSIAAKYKIYGRLRALEESSSVHKAGGQDKTLSKSHTRTKRKHADVNPNDTSANNQYTPRKARREIITPSKNHINPNHPATLDPYDSPSVFRRLFSPSTHRQSQQPSPLPLKTAIGPTPQRNGKILGLFDMLSASGGSTATPSAKRVATLDHAVVQTPSRRKIGQKLDHIPESADNEGNVEDDDEYEHTAMGRTPASSSKRLYLERLFATPTTLRFATMMEEEENSQPQRILYQKQEVQTDDKDALASGTPSFLRRSNSGRYVSGNSNDSANPLSPVGVRKHQRYNGKGLTALVQGLRDMENERMEDDWDILNEIEAEQTKGTAAENVQVGDSQASQVDAAGEDPNGGRVWKKKGQKRTTRLVKMKPVMQVKNKPPRAAATKSSDNTDQAKDEEEDEESEDELQTSANAQKTIGADENSLPPTRTLRERKQTTEGNPNEDDANDQEEAYNDIASDDNSSDSDFADTASPKQPLPPTTGKAMSSFSEKLKAAFSAVQPLKKMKKTAAEKNDEDRKKPSSPKKRKVNPDAHANYRSLKIRSKGQGRFGRGRFGRR